MTFVFRTSSFFVVFVITVKATTFVVGNTANGPAGGNSNSAADRLNDHVERLVDEAVRSRGEAREAADNMVDMAFALHVLGDRVIECAGVIRTAVEHTCASVWRVVRSSTDTNTGMSTFVSRSLRKALPKKEVKHDGYTAAG
ncbi:MAG: hypothetical protein ACYDB0_09640 [Acidithiobacillus sp.]